MNDFFMEEALELAKRAYEEDEVPIGCVIVQENIIIGKGYNQRNAKKNTLYHAEIIAIDQASRHLGDWRLEDCSIYVTIEPCPMCAGAILQARIPKLIFGAKNPKAGCCGSVINLLDNPSFNHKVEIVEGVKEQEASEFMSLFFRRFREY